MKLNENYLMYHDLIGFDVQVKSKARSTNQTFSDVEMIIDDTKNMIITQKNGKIKKYIKKNHVFKILLPEQEIYNNKKHELEVNGEKIIGRPENRLRNLKKKKWLRN